MSCIALGGFLPDKWESFLDQDPTCVFTKGACHAYAMELFRFLTSEITRAGISIVAIGNTHGGDHVVVRVGTALWDVTMNPILREEGKAVVMTNEDELCSAPVLLPAGQPITGEERRLRTNNWLSGLRKMVPLSGSVSDEPQRSPSATGSVNRFGHRIDQPFLNSARSKARDHISSNRVEFLRLARQGLERENKPLA